MKLFRSRRRREEELEEEIQSHLRMAEQDRMDRGEGGDRAKYSARREFGSCDLVKESVRQAWGRVWLDRLLQDLRYGFRMIRKNPGFSAAVIITLALGIGANTAIFHVLDTVDLRPLPVRNPDELVLLNALQDGSKLQVLSYPIVREMNAQQHVVQGIFASGGLEVVSGGIDGRIFNERVEGSYATGNYFRLLGADARLGRTFSESDDQPLAAPVAVISDRFWRREFGAGAAAIGRTFVINGANLQVIGVMPHDFFGETVGEFPDFWVPVNLAPQLKSKWNLEPSYAWLAPMARLRSDISRPAAQAALSILFDQLHDLTGHLKGASNFLLELKPIGHGKNRLEEFSKPLWLLMATAGFVILIACSNLASLFLARSAARTHEIGVRLATGASRSRLVRQLMTESLLLSSIGGVLGFAVGIWGARGLCTLVTSGKTLRVAANPDWRVGVFTALVTIGAACLFGLAPALSTARLQLNTALQKNSRIQTGGFEHRRAKAFVIAQLAISLILIAGASLLMRSFWNVLDQDWGYRQDGILVLDFAFDEPSFKAVLSPVFRETLLERLNAIHGVRSAAAAFEGPLRGVEQPGLVALPDRPSRETDQLKFSRVSPHIFETLDIHILAGRPITSQDTEQSQQVAVISQTAARKLFGAANPIGKFFVEEKQFRTESAIRIVGVFKDLHLVDPHEPFSALIFRPISQRPRFSSTPLWYIRTESDPARVMQAVRTTVRQMNWNASIRNLQPWSQMILSKIRKERMLAWIAGAFGSLALVLSCIGVFGVVSFGVQRRTREIGIRLALGATSGRVKHLLLREAATLLAISIVIGGAGTFMMVRWISSMLFGLTPYDPWMLMIAVLLLSGIAILSAYLPAHRAAHIDPINSLRQE
jgi:predicted permease